MCTKTALITGASSDIGQAIAISLASEGFNIAAHYHKNFAAVQNIKYEAQKQGVKAGLFCFDLVHPKQAKEMVNAVVKQFKSIDVLVNTMRLSEKPCFSIFQLYGLNSTWRSIMI